MQPRPRNIVVLLHESDDRFESENYLLRLLIDRWKAGGVDVQIIRGVGRFVPADLIIPHLDLTVTPPEYRKFLDRYPAVVNRRVLDTSKSRISGNLVKRDDSYSGPVIVKTNCNYGGLPEKRLAARTRRPLVERVLRKMIAPFRRTRAGSTDSRDWASIQSIKSHAYPVFASLNQVPPGAFGNKHLVVEKFLPEMDGADYCLRYCYFFGEQDVSILLRSKEGVIKGSNAHGCETTPTPDELRSARRQMGFDYGKFDFVLREGQVVLFDVNRTPAYATLDLHDLTSTVIERLAEGLAAEY